MGRFQLEPDGDKPLTIELAGMAASHGFIDLVPLLAALSHGSGNGRFGDVVAVRETQPVFQVAARFQMPAQGVTAEQLERLPCHFSSYERIPVAIAADPGPETQETPNAEGMIAVIAH